MSIDVPPRPNNQTAPEASSASSEEELVRRLLGVAASTPEPPSRKGVLRRKLLVGALIAGAGIGASFMSCIGQSFSLRQARAQEGIEQQLKAIRASCTVPRMEPTR